MQSTFIKSLETSNGFRLFSMKILYCLLALQLCMSFTLNLSVPFDQSEARFCQFFMLFFCCFFHQQHAHVVVGRAGVNLSHST